MDDSLAGRVSGSPLRDGVSAVDLFKTFVRFLLLGFGSLALLFVIQILLYTFAVAAFGDIPTTGMAAQIISFLSLGLGTLVVATAYLNAKDLDWSFLDVRRPSLRDVGWILVGVVLILLGFLVVVSAFQALGVTTAEHSSTDTVASGSPALVALFVAASILVVGPGEELLYRNIIQKSMYASVGKRTAVLLASVIFALVHIPAYSAGGAAAGAVASTLVAIFVLSLVLGGVYARTGNVLVPAMVHGIYNALSFYSTYANGGGGGAKEALTWLF